MLKILLPLIELAKYVVELAVKGKNLLAYSILLVVALAFGAYSGKAYVDQKHNQGIKAVKHNEEMIKDLMKAKQDVAAAIKIMSGSLKTINDSMHDVKDTVRATDGSVRQTQEKVIEIYKEVYEIKLKQSKGG